MYEPSRSQKRCTSPCRRIDPPDKRILNIAIYSSIRSHLPQWYIQPPFLPFFLPSFPANAEKCQKCNLQANRITTFPWSKK